MHSNIESLGFTSHGGIPLKTGTATQCPHTSLLGGDVTNQSHQIILVAYSDQNQGHHPNHPKHSQPLSPSGEHLGTTLGPKTGIRNPETSIPTPLQGEVTVCHYLWGTLPTKPVTAQVQNHFYSAFSNNHHVKYEHCLV